MWGGQFNPASSCICLILVCLVCMFFLLLSLYVCLSACSGCMNFFSREFFRVWIFFLSSPFTFPMAHPLKWSMEGVTLADADRRARKGVLTRPSSFMRLNFSLSLAL